jgi:DNA-binding HxlR family transcriptional regulator
MHYQTYDANICVMTKIVDLIGGKWKPIILYLIQHDNNRFGLLKKSMPQISRKVLTKQLRELEQDKLIVRNIQVATWPQVVVYGLTPKGHLLRKLIDDMIAWGLVFFKDEYTEELKEVFRRQ